MSPKLTPEVVEQKTQKDVLLEHLLIQEKRMQEALAGEWDDTNAEIEDNQERSWLTRTKRSTCCCF